VSCGKNLMNLTSDTQKALKKFSKKTRVVEFFFPSPTRTNFFYHKSIGRKYYEKFEKQHYTPNYHLNTFQQNQIVYEFPIILVFPQNI